MRNVIYFMATKISIYKNLSHIVQKFLIQMNNQKAFCDRHVKPNQALKRSSYIERMRVILLGPVDCPKAPEQQRVEKWFQERQMGVVARVGEGREKKDYGSVCWEAGGGGDFVSFITRPNQKVLYQWSREPQSEYDSMAENILTSQGLGLCKQSFTGLTIKSNLQNRLENPGV